MNYYVAYDMLGKIIWGVLAHNTDDARRFISDDLKAYGYDGLFDDWTIAGRQVHLESGSNAK